MQFYDTHCHLNDEAFEEDLEETLSRALEAHVTHLMIIAYDLDSARKMPEFCQKSPHFRGAVGVHPHDAAQWSESAKREIAALLNRGKERKILALGEIGLDYHYENSPRDVQKKAFWEQLELAHEYDVPVIIHDREAHRDCLDLLQEAKRKGLLRRSGAGVFHCYSGSPEMLPEVLNLGFYVGFDGPLTFKNARRLPEVLQQAPEDLILLETDAPYLAPVPYRGKRNEPSYLPKIAACVAQIKGWSIEETAAKTFENALRFFEDDLP